AVGQSVGNGARQADAMLAGDVARQIVVRRLIDVERTDVVCRHVEPPLAWVAVDESAGDVIGVRQRPIHGADRGDRLALPLARLGGRGTKRGCRVGGVDVRRLWQTAAQGQSCCLSKEYPS